MNLTHILSASLLATVPQLSAEEYTNFVRQVMLPLGVQWDVSVAPKGERSALLPIELGGSRFELWTVKNSPLTSYLLDTRYVGAYSPAAEIAFRSEDPYTTIPRTRADRPFAVDITIAGLIHGPSIPASGQSVKLLRHVQSYGPGGVGENISRSQASLLTQATLSQNGTQTLTYSITSVPSPDLTKASGEERFSVFSIPDALAAESQLASRYIQIWPVADASISGISQGERLRFKLPKLTITLNDLYPSSDTYVQTYPGELRSNVIGKRIASFVWNDSIPKSKVLQVEEYAHALDADGTWTMEVLTATPFGIDRLHHLTFEVDRSIKINSLLSTLE